ncbi:MAG: HAD family hydrolase [archaeon]|nr:HAD family hydrolase [archaeon]
MLRQKEIIGRITISKRKNSPRKLSPKLSLQRSKTSKFCINKNDQRNKRNISYNTVNINPKINPITQVTKNNSESVRYIMRDKSSKRHKSLSPKANLLTNQFLLPPKTSNKKTLVLDLDETLVHSGFAPFDCPSDVIIQIDMEGEIFDIHVLVRPYVKEFLERMSMKYELVIFTASLSKYANPLLNQIDNNGACPFRLFREHCTLINTTFVKDLTRLGRELKDIIILDNSPFAYGLNQDNGFPIESWFYDKNDSELLKIIPILEFLSYVPDVREYIRKIVKNNKIQFDVVSSVISSYNNKLKNNFIPMSLRSPSNSNLFGTENSNLMSNCPKLNKCYSFQYNHIKKIYIQSNFNAKKKPKKMLNINNTELTRNNRQTQRNGHLNKVPSFKEKDTFLNITEINRLNSSPSFYQNLRSLNLLRPNSSMKKIIYINTNEKTETNNPLKNKLKIIMTQTHPNNKPIIHKKSATSMTVRNKRNIL